MADPPPRMFDITDTSRPHSRRHQGALPWRAWHPQPTVRLETPDVVFRTDPEALDRVGWRVIDEKRQQVGMKSIAESKPDAHSTFLNRQPEHVEIAGALGLGEWDEKKVEIKRFDLA